MPVGIVDFFQIVQVKHQDPHIKRIVLLLNLRQLLFQRFFIVDSCHINSSTLYHALNIIFQCQ